MQETKPTKEMLMARFMEAKRKKQAYIQQLEKEMKAEYEQRTGKKANHFEVLWMIKIVLRRMRLPRRQ